ncbi:hypothetical protein CAPGI0001_1327 [Capnocytophaga gingivalis ATCC 33624]|nr:hypothetical protein CAPGI0001_1327 [Capnocytophaga gingivalis ATCC 33624]
MKVGNRFKNNDEKTSFIPKYCVFIRSHTRTRYSSNALTIYQLLRLNFWDNPIQSGFHGSLPLFSFIFYLSGNCRNKY